MPELPEVEVVRRGVADHVVGQRLERALITGARVARRHAAGPVDLAAQVTGRTVLDARRRGKYLWLTLDNDQALVVHLGMSGQLLVEGAAQPLEKHAHAVFDLSGGSQLRFVDQRTFGGLQLVDLVNDEFGPGQVPSVITHIAPDPLEDAWDQGRVVTRMRARNTQIKRALLDQSLVSGIGNIYADEALWLAKVHGERNTSALRRATLEQILQEAATVMRAALAKGGTSFDALYVNVNGASGYFERSLNAYGRAGKPCRRCGSIMRREAFMNRSSFSCPQCQRRPRLT